MRYSEVIAEAFDLEIENQRRLVSGTLDIPPLASQLPTMKPKARYGAFRRFGTALAMLAKAESFEAAMKRLKAESAVALGIQREDDAKIFKNARATIESVRYMKQNNGNVAEMPRGGRRSFNQGPPA